MKKFLSLLLAAAIAFSAVACGNTDVAEPTVEPTEVVEEAVYPVTVTDQLGREVTIESEPETLVSGYYISTSIIISLGLESKMVGIEAKADKRNIYKLAAAELIELPNVGTAKEFDLEGCAALNPDLVVLPAKLKDVIPSLEELGIAVIAVKPEDDELLQEAVEIIAKATNTEEKGQELLTYIDSKLDELDNSLNEVEEPTVYLASNSSILSTAADEMYQDTLIEDAGGVNVADEIGEGDWAEVSYEQIITWNPDYIILAADADYTVEDVLNDTNLASCNAVVNQNVYQFPSDIEAWDSPIPGSVLGNLWLASVLHGEEYAADNYEQAVVEFYETFYGFTPEM